MEIVKWLMLLLLVLNREVTTGLTIHDFCTSTSPSNLTDDYKSMAWQDYNVITLLLGCHLSNNGNFERTDIHLSCNQSIGEDFCRVTEIDFSTCHLRGTLPHQIGNLKHLRELDLSENRFHGEIPSSIAHLSELVVLDLSGNYLEGSIPQFLGDMKSLKFLYLYGNFVNGSIPSNLGSLVNLKDLVLRNNLLSHEIPMELGNLTSLEILVLGDNEFRGPLPSSFKNLKNLLYLELRNNQLNGSLPDQLFGNLTSLQVLDISNNKFYGPLPSSIMKLENLIGFAAQGNNLNGRIPSSIGQLQNLQALLLMGNSFSGSLPGEISMLTSLSTLSVSDLVGGESKFPDFSKMYFLEDLTLRNCSINDTIPDKLWNLESLDHLDLSVNSLYGGIPANVSHKPSHIFLRRNNLTEKIPTWIMNLTWIRNSKAYVDISENLFTNDAKEISKLNSNASNLNVFSCCKNPSPSDMRIIHWEQVDYSCGNNEKFDHLNINCGGDSMLINRSIQYEADLDSHGGSTFVLSKSLRWGYSSMGSYLPQKGDIFTVNDSCINSVGDGPLYSTARVSPISLKYYGFCLRNGNYTVKLLFAELVSNKHKTTSRKTGRLFDVDIQGKSVLKSFSIENEAGGVNIPIHKEFDNIRVDNSRLEIHLYWSGKGPDTGSTLLGPLVSAISVYPSKERGMPPQEIAGISVSVLLILILLIAFMWKLEDKSHEEELGLVELYPGGLYNYRKLKAATKNFSADNKLGEGGFGAVYKGLLSNGTVVAVKKVYAVKEGMHEFLDKNRIISPVEHPNLIKLMGCFVEKNQRLLVYEHVGENSLENSLFGSEELRLKLDWPTRHRICLGIAEGLAFLHEKRIVHGDIKPTNIFLDEDLTPKISDFGFTRLYDQGKSRVEGTTIYTAPEYATYGRLTAMADVYSFGVLILVVVSGKKEKSSRSSDGTDTYYLLDEVNKREREGTLYRMVDPSLGCNEEAETIIEMAILCLAHCSVRPTMSKVVKFLKKEISMDDLKCVEEGQI